MVAIGEVAAFLRLGQREDPDFAFRAMVVRTLWPGATAEQVDLSFLWLGLRTGLVVALTIPLVLAATFLAMRWFGIDRHRVSTDALITAAGFLPIATAKSTPGEYTSPSSR